MSDLPYGWSQVPFHEVAAVTDYVANGSFAALKENVTYLQEGYGILVRLTDWKKNWTKDFVYVDKHAYSFLSKSELIPGDIVVSCVGEPGQVFQVPDLGRPMTLGPNSVRIREVPEVLDKRYFSYYWKSSQGQQELAAITTGTTQLKFNKTGLRSSIVRLAPLKEQKRIADKLDAVLTRVDAVNTRLARVAPLLKRFRQSVLAAATSGRLTEDWRLANPSFNARSWLDEISRTSKTSSRRKPLEPSLSDLSETVQLPETWTVTGLDSIAADKPHALKAGPFGSALKKSMYVSHGYKIYGQEQVIAGDETVGEYFIDDEKFAELKACAVESGDILISLVGTIGRVLVLSPNALPGIINPRLVKLSLHLEVNRSYFSFYLRSPIALSFFEGNSHGGTMDILNLGILRSLPLLIPPPAEQTEIVRRVETLFAFADRLEARLVQAQTAATRLTPALLAKAFRGELVPQDPNDEPATELLKRLAGTTTASKRKPWTQTP